MGIVGLLGPCEGWPQREALHNATSTRRDNSGTNRTHLLAVDHLAIAIQACANNAIDIRVVSATVRDAIAPLTFIVASIGKGQGSPTVPLVVPPLALVPVVVRPGVSPPTIRHSVSPLTLIVGAIERCERSPTVRFSGPHITFVYVLAINGIPDPSPFARSLALHTIARPSDRFSRD